MTERNSARRALPGRRAARWRAKIHRLPCLHQRDIVVITKALKDEKRCRDFATVRDHVRATDSHTVAFTRAEPHFFFWVAQEEPDTAFNDVERIPDVTVEMP